MPSNLVRNLWFARGLYALFFLVFPLFIINDTYGIFQTHTKTTVKITGGLIMAVLIAWFFLRKYLKKWIEGMAPGGLRIVCHALYKSALLIIVWVFIIMSEDVVNAFLKCFGAVTVCIIIANIVEGFEEVYEQQIKEIKLLKRQDKYRKDYNL